MNQDQTSTQLQHHVMLSCHTGGAPAFTLGGRISPPRTTAQETPAPGDYGSPGDGGQHGLAFTLGGKRKEADPALHLNVSACMPCARYLDLNRIGLFGRCKFVACALVCLLPCRT